MVEHVRQAADAVGISVGDIAILCDTNKEAGAARAILSAAGIQSMSLLDYTGVPVEAVKVGTINRAKGLEFKLVILPWTPAKPRHTDEERAARELRERYVAATRARDALWIGFC
jgi:ATP-dependent exoDNAse (exonuclease V) beta subunit